MFVSVRTLSLQAGYSVAQRVAERYRIFNAYFARCFSFVIWNKQLWCVRDEWWSRSHCYFVHKAAAGIVVEGVKDHRAEQQKFEAHQRGLVQATGTKPILRHHHKGAVGHDNRVNIFPGLGRCCISV